MQKRSLNELIDTQDPAWPLVQQWIKDAKNSVEVLPVNRTRAEEVLLYLQVTTRSPLGTIAYETGGLLIDHGWLRILGSGHSRMQGDLLTWNTDDLSHQRRALKGACIVAYDVVGGFFAINGGAFPGRAGNVFYFGPDTLKWHALDGTYSQFLVWSLSENLAQFYKKMRWQAWEDEVAPLSGDKGLSIFPFLFTEPELPLVKRSRRAVPMWELWNLHFDLAQQL